MKNLSGLILAPSWLLGLLEIDFHHWTWSCDKAAVIEPQSYHMTLAAVQYFDRLRVARAPTAAPCRWEKQGRAYFTSENAPDMGIPRHYWELQGWAEDQGLWAAPEFLQQAWAQWHATSDDYHWAWSQVQPLLPLMASKKWYIPTQWAPSQSEFIWEGESFPLCPYEDWQWWFQGRGYDFIVVWSGEPWGPLPADLWPLRSLFWASGGVHLNAHSGRRLLRWSAHQCGPLWYSDHKKGFFYAPLYWPLRLDLLEHQWHLLQSLLWGYATYHGGLITNHR